VMSVRNREAGSPGRGYLTGMDAAFHPTFPTRTRRKEVPRNG
jgi:hypothetical protein